MAKTKQHKQLEFSFTDHFKECPSVSPDRSKKWFILIRAVMRGDIDPEVAIDVMNTDCSNMIDFEKIDLWLPSVHQHQLN